MTETHAVVVPRRGGPEVLELQTRDLPDPGPGEVRVRVEAAGVSAYDTMLRGHRFPGFPGVPYTPGEDVVGIVDALGPGVSNLRPGQRVGGWTFGDAGGYAEHLCRQAADLVPVPDGIDPAVAVALIVNYLTAWLALHRAVKVEPGERLLVQGAGGGLGSALLQLAREAGLDCYGCDAASKHERIRADGATPVDYRRPGFVKHIRELSGGGVDAVIDVVGGPGQLLRSYRSLRRGGRLLMLGMAGSSRFGTGIILPSLVVLGGLAIWPDGRRIASGPGMENYPRAHPDWYRATLAEFFRLALEGRLQPHLAERIQLSRASEAHRLLESGRAAGKVILTTEAYSLAA